MTTAGSLLVALVLFLAGLRLSAFFSGAETGFYRISHLRLGIDADRGDRRAQRLAWFAKNPGHFVATTLVGNNLANYVTTLGVGLAAATIVGVDAGWVEVVATLLVTPVVFVFGELLPKNLFYRAPMSLLHGAAPLFVVFYRVFLPVSIPLVLLAQLFERLSGSSDRLDALLGRSRLVQALSQGHEHGLLTDAQDRLAHGVLEIASQSVRDAMTPADRVLGISADTSRAEALDFAGRFGATHLIVREADGDSGSGSGPVWVGYVRAVDLAISRLPWKELVRPLPEIESSASKLDALAALHEVGESRGVVVDGERQLGIVGEQGLVEHVFRTPNVLRAGRGR